MIDNDDYGAISGMNELLQQGSNYPLLWDICLPDISVELERIRAIMLYTRIHA
jgi:hypothetical protein